MAPRKTRGRSSKRLTQHHCAKLAAGGGGGGEEGGPAIPGAGVAARGWGGQSWNPHTQARAQGPPWTAGLRAARVSGHRQASWLEEVPDFRVLLGVPIHPGVPKSAERRLPRALMWLLGQGDPARGWSGRPHSRSFQGSTQKGQRATAP